MVITRKIKLITPLLALRMNSNAQPRPRREFNKEPSESNIKIQADMARWNWAFLEARDALGLEDVATSAIIPAPHYTVGRTSTYTRRYRRGRADCREDFEALPTGQVLTWEFTLSRYCPPGGDGNGRFDRPPDEVEFDQMLSHIGDRLGMSEWGHAYLYGRFVIKDENQILHSKG